ncbi:hypothetical protein BDV95DRAFT_563072 [Massariosphaeria phaeospora]|uniref:Uncharacterized protein n=1 Tax=Massariosphaeria phaeospora TaxID=100035 RepID=A0A7C8IG21_9PLEO|nr:hypothetical protein BDV95DRAFT_563072 [Massariosphaeria phaeospora]
MYMSSVIFPLFSLGSTFFFQSFLFLFFYFALLCFALPAKTMRGSRGTWGAYYLESCPGLGLSTWGVWDSQRQTTIADGLTTIYCPTEDYVCTCTYCI